MQPQKLLQQATRHYQVGKLHRLKPSLLVALFSGGDDSVVSTHLAHRWTKAHGHSLNFVALTIDTGISADGWREYVSGVARAYRWHHIIWDNPNPYWYEQNTMEFGFPYTRANHTIQYRMLKERAIKQALKYFKKFHFDRVVFVTGIRRDEGQERKDAPYITRFGADIWVNAIADMTLKERNQYIDSHGLPRNPFYAKGLGSGDCQCNWGNFCRWEVLERESPQLAAKLRPLHTAAKQRHGWGWDGEPGYYIQAVNRGQLEMFPTDTPFLCAGCENKKGAATAKAEEWRILQAGI